MMYLSALNMPSSEWFFLVLVTFGQMADCRLQTKTSKKAVLWQGNRMMPLQNSIPVKR